VLKANVDSGQHLHIVEDDSVFSRFTEPALRWVIETGMIDQFDILFTGTFVTPMNDEYRYCKVAYDRSVDRDPAGGNTALRLQVIKHIAGTNSYMVNRNAIGKLVDILIRELSTGARYPLDLTFRVLADKGVLRTGALFPFVTGVRLARTLSTTVVGRRHHEPTAVAAWLGRHSFFVDCDFRSPLAQAEELLQIPANDLHHSLLARVLSFSLTEKYQPF
jgi:hypothetical protein